MDNLITEYQNAITTIKSYREQSDSINAQAKKEASQIEWNAKEEAREIERIASQKAINVREAAIKKISELTKNQAELMELRAKVQRYFKLLECKEVGGFKKEPEIYSYSHKDLEGNYIPKPRKIIIEPVGIVRQDKYNDIRLYIVENGNAVNYLSLIIRGNSFFGDKLLNRPTGKYSYITNCHDSNTQIRITVKTSSSKKELLSYIERPANMKKIQKMLPDNLDELAKEYELVCELIKDTDWQILYLEHRKWYYETQYSNGEETPEYKDIMKKLKELKRN